LEPQQHVGEIVAQMILAPYQLLLRRGQYTITVSAFGSPRWISAKVKAPE
jgi:hypothetical protein